MGKDKKMLTPHERAKRMDVSARVLLRRLTNSLSGMPPDGYLVSLAKQIIQDHRTRFREREGIELPDLVVLLLPVQEKVEFYRADLPPLEIEAVIKDIRTRYPTVGVDELGMAVAECWPHFAQHAGQRLMEYAVNRPASLSAMNNLFGDKHLGGNNGDDPVR